MRENIIRSLRGEEGEVLHEYKDHLGYSTIGIGRLIDKRKGGGITSDEAAYLLGNDVDKVIDQLNKRLPWWSKLDEARRGVLVNMAFQMGIDGLLGFKNTLAMIQAGNYESAARGMLQSKWAQQTPSRAKRMAEQMRSGQWQYKPGF
ncbi:lysozyme [Acinetobacter phage vB_AbaP_Alexa]|nr:lysozyme [Acinetobacter phage vB_AbaP_Alexa]